MLPLSLGAPVPGVPPFSRSWLNVRHAIAPLALDATLASPRYLTFIGHFKFFKFRNFDINHVPTLCSPQSLIAVPPRRFTLHTLVYIASVSFCGYAVAPTLYPGCPYLVHSMRGGFAAIRGAQPHPLHTHVAVPLN